MQSRFQLISPARSPSVGSHSIRSTSCSGNLAVCRVGVPVGHCSVGLQACASKPGPFPTICLASRIVGYSCHLPALASWPDIVGRSGMADAFRDVRDALAARQGSPGSGWVVEHNDVTCDGCEAEPIIGSRFRCTVCPDRDLCERCMRGMMAARLEISRGGEGAARILQAASAVPCLDPSHRYERIIGGPERSVWHRGSTATMAEFLDAFPPSKASCADVAWIGVSAPQDEHLRPAEVDTEAPGTSRGDREEQMLWEWDKTDAVGQEGTRIALKLAEKYGILSGKWMVRCTRPSVDSVWSRIAFAVAEGKLGPAAKVSPVTSGQDTHVICVYVRAGTTDLAERQAVLEGLREVLKSFRDEKLRTSFKPDAFTILGIYYKNSRKIPPTVETATLF